MLWDLHVTNRADGEMVLALWQTPNEAPSVPVLGQDPPPVAARRWVHVEAYWKRGLASDGHLTVWQDGVLTYDRANVTTSSSEHEFWGIDSIAQGLSCVMYVDDALVSSVRIGPLLR